MDSPSQPALETLLPHQSGVTSLYWRAKNQNCIHVVQRRFADEGRERGLTKAPRAREAFMAVVPT